MGVEVKTTVALPIGIKNANHGPADLAQPAVQLSSLPVEYDFVHGFVAAFSMIVVSELGDKTFFISAILAMKYSRLIVYAGAVAALAGMHVLSALVGSAALIIPRFVTYYVSAALFAVFGLKMLREGFKMSVEKTDEEFEEAQEDIKRREAEESSGAIGVSKVSDTEAAIGEIGSIGSASTLGLRRLALSFRRLANNCFSRVFIQSFTLNFLAEWGDRSQITAIVLATREDILGVMVGGAIGHALCTGLAVVGGRCIAQRISVRTITIIGGIVFLLFAVSVLFIDSDSNS